MSQRNVETVRAIWDAINRGDFDDAVRHLPDDFVADWSASESPESAVYRGRAEIRRAFEEASESWSEADYFEDEVIDAGDRVIRVGGLRARGRGSGAEVVAHGTQVWAFSGGTPVSVRLYQSKEEGLEAVGLSE
jgi:ketosteroid isomerase-like protein